MTKKKTKSGSVSSRYHNQLVQTLQKLDIMAELAEGDSKEKKKIAELRSRVSDKIISSIFRGRKGGIECCALDPQTKRRMML